ncbi:MAG: preprotein translocase subunit SecG [Rhodobacteraceae bacterium]|nr:preprotein translocase subunit SecG [Paracoccaceae bacterium]
MQNIVLVIHLILALCLIGIVLIQRSEGGGLGIGGGGGGASSRPPANAMTKLTWMVAGAFVVTSISLFVISAQESSSDSVLERAGATTQTTDEPATEDAAVPTLGDDLLPPTPTDEPAAPPKAEE